MNIFIKNSNNKDYIGKVWGGKASFPDFFHPNTSIFWSKMLQKLDNLLNFSGIWLDMNEVSNFDTPYE